jgi:hypothetical protein
MASLKQKIYEHCIELLDKKAEEVNSALRTVTESANNETKSSVGDKHETARAMMQLEQEKLSKQLIILLEQKAELEKMDITKTPLRVAKGSLVESDKGYLFVSVGLGKVIVEGKTIFAISPESPIGKKLMGLSENETAEMNGVKYLIKKLW